MPAATSVTSSSGPKLTSVWPMLRRSGPKTTMTWLPSLEPRHRKCALGRIRTYDTWFRKPVLYPLSYESRRHTITPDQLTRSLTSLP